MMLRMEYLVRRRTKDGRELFQYRREVPEPLRAILGKREIKQSLGTSDLAAAQRKWAAVHADAERMFAEARAGVKSPAIVAYRAVEAWREGDVDHEEAIDSHLTMLLERGGLDPTQRAM